MKETPRHKALLNGDPEYFTGKPCKYGHIAYRSTLMGECKECRKEINRKQKQKDRETFLRAQENG